MPLDGDRLGSAIVSAIQSVPFPQENEDEGESLEAFWKAVAQAIVDEFKTNGLVNSSGTSLPFPPGGPAPINNLPGQIT